MPSESPSLKNDLTTTACGLLMGAADIVPGVSGGTVALLLGIYPRLVTAISSVDADLFRLIGKGRWREAAGRLDLRFLAALAVGILAGVLTLAGVVHWLLDDHRQLTMAGFFGLILGSSVLVARMAKPIGSEQTMRCVVMGIIACVFAAWLVSLDILDQPPSSLGYVFACGAIAICAMILPGISGAYLLVMLGKYEDITDILHRLKAGDVTSGDFVTLVVFMAGCLIGLLLFSKVLKALLARFHSETMAVLGGFMVGSLLKVWPFQAPIHVGAELSKTTITKPEWPTEWNSHVAACLSVAFAACVLVIAMDAIARRRREKVITTEK